MVLILFIFEKIAVTPVFKFKVFAQLKNRVNFEKIHCFLNYAPQYTLIKTILIYFKNLLYLFCRISSIRLNTQIYANQLKINFTLIQKLFYVNNWNT